MQRWHGWTVGLAAAAVAATACSDAAQGGETAAPPVVDVVGGEYLYELPEDVPSGIVSLRLVNEGSLPHEFGLMRLGSGTAEEALAALDEGRDVDDVEDVAGVGILSGGQEVTVTRDLGPGTYAFYCYLPTPEGVPHHQEGMVATFTVGDPSGAAKPPVDGVIEVTDEGITLPELAAGRRRVEVRNAGTTDHELMLIGYEPGRTDADIETWIGGGYAGDAPAVFPGGIQAIPPGAWVVLDLDLEAGRTYHVEDFPNELSAELTPTP